jgi:hypothetical protein
MSDLSARSRPLAGNRAHVARIADVRPKLARLVDWRSNRNSLLDDYLEGWAEANSAKILAAAAPDFCFYDPLVGTFARRTMHAYFELLQDKLSGAGGIRRLDVAFFLHGPMGQRPRAGEFPFWREAPRIGLTGVSAIRLGKRGVIAESVAYDLNLASDALRRAFEESVAGSR